MKEQVLNSFDIIHRLYLYSNIYSTAVSVIAVSEGEWPGPNVELFMRGNKLGELSL